MIARGGPARPGQTLLADKGYRSAAFEAELAAQGITLIRPATRTEPPRPGERFLRPLRQIIESIIGALKDQLGLERHRARSPPASGRGSCNASSPSPRSSGTTKQPNNPAPPAASSPTTTDPLQPTI